MAVRGSNERRQNESQSDPPLFFFRRLYVDAGIAAPGIEGHTDGDGPVQHNPIEAAQGGSPSEDYRAQDLDFIGGRLSIHRSFLSGFQKYSGCDSSLLNRCCRINLGRTLG